MFRLITNRSFKENNIHQYDEYLIRLKNVTKAYKTDAGDFLALKNINLNIGPGEFVGVIGKSGSGKSTLINMMSGIDRPTHGEVYVADTPIHTLSEGSMAQWRGHNLGIVFQFFQLLPILTVLENVILPLDFCNLYNSRQRYERAIQVLNMVGVAQQAHKLPSQLSGGEQQRVAIARALVSDPPIIMADEPTGNLDSKTSAVVFQVFEKLVADGKTIVMVTHDGDLAKRVNRTIIIADGEIIEEYLAKTFPTLTQPQLVWTTSKLTQEKFTAGSIILRKGEHPNKFYIVTRGQVEVVLQTSNGEEYVVARMQKGQYFGEIGMMRGGLCMATVRAAGGTDVEVAALDNGNFDEFLAQSKAIKDALNSAAEERIKENIYSLEERDNAYSSLA